MEMILGPGKPLLHSILIAKGTEKRNAPNAAQKGGDEQLQPWYQMRDKAWNKTGQTNKDIRENQRCFMQMWTTLQELQRPKTPSNKGQMSSIRK